ncbi:MAG: UDP-glucose/GDP-mannose dehydrogenase family protein [Bacteroidetes bacterium]|nr:UDP-glucose/GDP-mannose dehydrogenase family protein [Bacteroidota bacterium]
MKIAIVGTGYVGLVTGTCFAEVGIEVQCIDIDQRKIDGLKAGKMPIYEPGLEEMVLRNYQNGRLHFSTQLGEAIQGAEAIFIAVGTPPGEDGSADLQYVLGVATEIGKNLQHYAVVVTKSTVPVSTNRKVHQAVQRAMQERGTNIPFDVASNPEFLKEGAAIEDFLKPDRIVVGCESQAAQDTLSRLYKPFTLNGHPILFMDIPSAEMTKYAANAMLATKISFMNDVALLCDIMGASVDQVRKGIGSDPRIGNKFIYPGVGYGGSCFPKDVKALIRTAKENGHRMRILEAVEEVNEDQKKVMGRLIREHFGTDLHGLCFGIWGLSFKPKTDDMREAPSVVIIEELLAAGAQVRAYDPVAMHEAKQQLGERITYASDPYSAIQGADALVLITEWPEFRIPEWDRVESLLRRKVIFDGRNQFQASELRERGFHYRNIGNP